MKKNKLVLIGSMLVVTLGVLFTFSKLGMNEEGEYKKNDFSFLQKSSIDDASAWMAARLRDPETGEKMTDAKLRLIDKAVKNMPKGKALSLTWVEEGPDNIGGRTRAILVDRTNNSRLWAGSVSGGLFVSTNGANTWTKVTTFPGAKFISSMTQLQNGAIVVATGIGQSADPMAEFSGDGVWYSSDFGVTWTIVPGTNSILKVSEVVCADNSNKLWIGTTSVTPGNTSGMKTWEFGAASLTDVNPGVGACQALKISKDGSVIAASIGGNKVYVSTDGGASFLDKSGTAANFLVPPGAARIELAISPTKNTINNAYTIYAVRTGSNLTGMHVSQDAGGSWDQFIGAINPPSNVDIYRSQGTYNTVAAVSPTSTETLFVGGIDVWKWTQATNNPPAGGIEPASFWAASPTSPIYVHADNHEFTWDANNRLYVGNDGGVGVTNNQGTSWYPANRGYNVTQFYGIAFSKNGDVIGGAQDNGTVYNDHTLSTPMEFREVGGGDGFQCAISFYNPDILFGSSQYGNVYRSGTGGTSGAAFYPDNYPASYSGIGDNAAGGFPFYTSLKLFEHFDTNSEDSVIFAPAQNYTAGSLIQVPSAASGNMIQYTTPTAMYYDEEVNAKPSLTQNRVSVTNTAAGNSLVQLGNFTYTFNNPLRSNPVITGDSLTVNFVSGPALVVVGTIGSYPWYYAQHPISNKIIELGADPQALSVPWDTAIVQDPYQSWFVVYVNQNGGELWGTRDALRLSKSPVWFPIVKGIGGTNADKIDIEFSKDLNRMYVSTGAKVTRVDGLGSLYTSDSDFQTKAGYGPYPTFGTAPTATTVTTVSTGAVEGIALNPSNSDELIIFSGAAASKRSLNAGSASPTFTTMGTISGINSPITYDGIIDRDDNDIIVVGTSVGAFVSDDGGATWTNSSAGFEGTPVYMVLQSTRTYAEGNTVPGVIYLGTHGRGIWKSSDLLGLQDDSKSDVENFKTKLKAFPNPTEGSTSLSFELFQAGDVVINVYSIIGTKVKSITVKNVSKGTGNLDLNVADLERGTYIVKFTSGGQNQSTKFIKR
jgi:hypothetical protein